MAFTFDSAPTTAARRPYRLDWGRVAAAGVNIVLWSLIVAAAWGALRMAF